VQVQFKHIDLNHLLKPYIEKMWVFKSDGRLPADDLKLVVPNGNIKLSVFCSNGIVASMNGKRVVAREQSINLTGLFDVPLTLDAEKDIFTETIGIEFNPKGAYRFFHFNLSEIKNQIYSFKDILGNTAKQLEEQIAHATSIEKKTVLLQRFLLKQFSLHNEDLIFEFCIERIKSSKGKITVKELERATGYSSRWLNIKFIEKLGISPKDICSIIRFSQIYQALTSANGSILSKNDFYEYYYDQSHFIKNFKHYTGLSPFLLDHRKNDFGAKFYQA